LTVLVAARGAAANAWWRRGLVATPGLLRPVIDHLSAHPGATAAGRLTYLTAPYLAAIALRLAEASELGLALPPSGASWLLAAAIAIATAMAILAVSVSLVPVLVPLGERRAIDRQTAGALALETCALEAHWAFFRAAVLTVGLSDTGAAVFVALGLLALEAWSDPRRRVAIRDPMAAHRLAVQGCAAIMSGLVFLATGSTPVCILAHLALRTGLLAAGVGETPMPLPGLSGDVHEPTTVEATVV